MEKCDFCGHDIPPGEGGYRIPSSVRGEEPGQACKPCYDEFRAELAAEPEY